MPKREKNKPAHRFIFSIAGVCALAAVLLGIRIVQGDSLRYVFLYWNLVLAVLPALIAWLLVLRLKQYPWLKWQQILLSVLWLLFLPNSFYIVTDFIHLRETYEVPLLYDIALITSFVVSGMVLGYTSVYLIHRELVKRLNRRHVWYTVAGVFLLSSFAIYLGRFSRWNTWDILLAPAGLLFDVSDRVVNPAAHTETYVSTFTVFVLLFSIYWVIWEAIDLVRR